MFSHAKHLGHQLYEIERNAEFINDMNRIFERTSDKQQELLFYINSGENTLLREKLGQLLMSDTDYNEIDLFKCDESGYASIHYACIKDHSSILSLLLSFLSNDIEKLSKYINLQSKATGGRTPILECVVNENINCLKVLLKCDNIYNSKLNINCRDGDGDSALHRVLKYSRGRETYNIASLLINDKRSDLTIKDGENRSLWVVACNQYLKEVFKLLYERMKFDINLYSIEGWTPLHYASSVGTSENDKKYLLLKYLLSLENIDVNKREWKKGNKKESDEKEEEEEEDIHDEMTALGVACAKSNEKTLKLLLNHSKIEDKYGVSLSFATRNGFINGCKLIYNKFPKSSNIDYAFKCAVLSGSSMGIKFCIELENGNKIDVNKKDKNGMNCILYAINIKLVDKLMLIHQLCKKNNCKIDWNVKNSNGQGILQISKNGGKNLQMILKPFFIKNNIFSKEEIEKAWIDK